MPRETIQSYLGGTRSCPICQGEERCGEHLLGYTDDGQTVTETKGKGVRGEVIRADDVLLKIGFIRRVYGVR